MIEARKAAADCALISLRSVSGVKKGTQRNVEINAGGHFDTKFSSL